MFLIVATVDVTNTDVRTKTFDIAPGRHVAIVALETLDGNKVNLKSGTSACQQ